MEDTIQSKSTEPVEKISSDLEALRELGKTDARLGWSRQFGIILILFSAFVVIVWYGLTMQSIGQPVIFASGVTVEGRLGSADWVAPALEQAMAATIQSGDQLRVVSPNINYFSLSKPATSAIQSGASWDLQAVLRAGGPGTETVVIQLSLLGLGRNASNYSADLTGSSNSVGDLATRAVQQVLSWLELDSLSPQQLGYARNEIPSPTASEAYGNGLIALGEGNGRLALAHFERARKIAPNNAVVYAGLASAWELLGYKDNAVAESKRAVDASNGLTRRRQLEFEARYALKTESWSRAQQVFGALKEFHPGELTYRLAFAETQARQNDAEGFKLSVSQMRELGGVSGEDPRIDIAEADFWFDTGDYGKCEALSQAAKVKAENNDDKHMLGEALLNIGRCDDNYDPESLLRARDLFQQTGTPLRESAILRELAKHEFGEGKMEQYLAYLQEALEVAQQLGNEPEIAASKNSLGQAYDLHGWLNRGYALKKEVAEYQAQRNNKNRHSILLENMSISLFKMGRYDEAEEAVNRAGAIFTEIDDQIGIAWLPYRHGQIALRRGNIELARELLSQALKNSEERPEGNLAIEATHELGLVNYFAGDYDTAAQLLGEANAVYREQGMSASIGESEIALARLASQRFDTVAALRHLQVAEEHLHDDTAYYQLSLRSEQTLFGSALVEADLKNACNKLDQATEGQEHMALLLRAKTKIVACRGLLGTLPSRVSHPMLVAIEQEANRLGIFDVVLAAGYTRVALLRANGQEQAAEAEFERVNQLASEKGWVALPLPDLATL